MHDSYGDGWNGATIQVFINSIPVGTFSASNFGSNASIAICDGDSLDLVYSAGDYENENSYELQDSSWNIVFQDGPTPDTGSVFSSIGNCNTPLLQGSHPCTAIPIDTGQCVFTNNIGFPGSGLNPNCANYQGGDMWFSMQVPPSGNLSFETDSGNINDTGIAVWTDSICNSPQFVGCDDDAGNGYYSFLLLFDLTPGETIFIQVWKWGGGTGSFELCVNDLGTVVLDSSEIPIVLINTLGQTIIEDTKVDCLMDIKYNGPGNTTYVTDSANVYSGNIGIEIRGLTSASYPQRPYGVETRDSVGANNNVSILGMPPENDWVLLSNFNDRSLIKNLLAFKLFGEMGNYSPRAQLCEVLIDSSYKGIYVIGEKIKRDVNRVAIAKLTPADTTGDDLSGGYMLQQNYWNANNSFQSNYSPIDHPGFDVHFVYEYPDEFAIQAAQKAYIASYVDSLETALYSPGFADTATGYRKYMDVKSFIDYFLVNELARSADGFKKSVFFHKDKYSNGGKLKAGPVWDFDWGWKNMDGVCTIFEGYTGAGWAHQINDCFTDNYSTGWYVRLLQDSTFNNELRCTYENYRQTILDTTNLFAYIDSVRVQVQNAQLRHFKKWPLLGKSGAAPDFGTVATTYNAELDSLKSWIGTRIKWLDTNIPGLCITTGITESGLPHELHCYPNPANDFFNIDYYVPTNTKVTALLYNSLGTVVLSTDPTIQSTGQHTLQLETKTLSNGVYILKFYRGTDILTKKMTITR
ncbi:MAG: CotH kinase family protein [Bacteroidetes bacterium]|nr:CotH kinase family protein [Bacteroidota bacterium]